METMIQPKITGYRQLNEAEAALMNEIKAHAEEPTTGAWAARAPRRWRQNRKLNERRRCGAGACDDLG